MTLPSDPFETFAARYDRMRPDESAQKKFFRTLFERYRVATVLDCACGTGRDLILLHSLGVSVVGADISDAMLVQAGACLKAEGIDVPVHRVDFRHLPRHFDRRFDAVLCLGTSLPQLVAEDEMVAALRSMREVLAPGGILVLSQGMTDRQYQARLRFVPVVNTPEFSRIMVIDYHEKEWEVHVIDLTHAGAESGFEVADFRYALLLADDYDRLLQRAGFTDLAIYGSLSLTPYDKAVSNLLLVVARA